VLSVIISLKIESKRSDSGPSMNVVCIWGPIDPDLECMEISRGSDLDGSVEQVLCQRLAAGRRQSGSSCPDIEQVPSKNGKPSLELESSARDGPQPRSRVRIYASKAPAEFQARTVYDLSSFH
jgi:hypothetical protein